MPSDLETNLVKGGLAPSLAKVIANAIDNAATARLSIGDNRADATPTDQMRMIDGDTRRYLLTNLDHPHDSPFRKALNKRGVQYTPRDTAHPYADSQPASTNPRIDTRPVKAGRYVAVDAARTNEVAQSEVGLNVKPMGGAHARLNAATGAVESVPIVLQFEPEGLLAGEVVEEAGRTVIKIRVVSTLLRELLKKKLGTYNSIKYLGQDCVLRVSGSNISSGEAFVLLPE